MAKRRTSPPDPMDQPAQPDERERWLQLPGVRRLRYLSAIHRHEESLLMDLGFTDSPAVQSVSEWDPTGEGCGWSIDQGMLGYGRPHRRRSWRPYAMRRDSRSGDLCVRKPARPLLGGRLPVQR